MPKDNKDILRLKAKIKSYNMAIVFDKLVKDNKIVKDDVPELEKEFKKFIVLVGLGIHPIAMISPLVDEVWHQFILFTKEYQIFCKETVGYFIHHTPDTEQTPIPVVAGENLRKNYKKFFGKLPDIWFKNMSDSMRHYYLQPKLTIRPPESWSGWAGPEN